MTGKDIQNAAFEKAGMRGYRADQVDAYLHTIAEYVDEQNEKIEDLTYKLKVLADKVEEYRSDEENIREALLGAQKLGSSIVNEAKAKAQALAEEAQASADEMMAQAKAKVEAITKESLQRATADLNALKRECDAEQRSYEMLKKEISKLKANIMQQYRSHIAMVMALPSIEEQKTDQEKESEETLEKEQAIPFASEAAEKMPENLDAAPKDAAEADSGEEADPMQTTLAEAADMTEKAEEEPGPILESRQEQESETKASATIPFARLNEQEEAHEEKQTRPNYMEKFGELRFGGFNDSDHK